MTRKDYLIVAARIAQHRAEESPQYWATINKLARGLADDFAADRPEFDRDRFLWSCGLEA